jgi:ADP-ribosylglycohydrolase
MCPSSLLWNNNDTIRYGVNLNRTNSIVYVLIFFLLVGQWLCRTCSMGQKPECVLCPNKGGAMKSTRSGQKWAHVSCALWIPEVSIGSVDRMEPITKISSIPQSRWALVCVLCRERVGACIQCSVKTCKTAYHVTCAFQHGLEMRAIIEDENAEDGVKLRSYCQKHSVKKEPKNSAKSEKASKATASVATAAAVASAATTTGVSEDEEKANINSVINNNNINSSNSNINNKKKLRKEMTSEERNHARLQRLMEIQSEFDKHVSVKDISCHLLDVDQEGINTIYNYWILKRKAGGNEPLLLPKAGDVDVMSQTDQEQADIEKMKMFVHLRQDLERVRNLCYMVSRREKLSRSFFKMREQIFHKQIATLGSHKKTTKLDDDSLKAILEANHGPSIYDVLYSSDAIRDSRVMRIDEMIDSILGNGTTSSSSINTTVTASKAKATVVEVNGNIKRDKLDAISRYSKLFNGSTKTSANRKYSSYDESLSSESDDISVAIKQPARIKTRASSSASASTSDDDNENDDMPPQKIPNKIMKSTAPTSQSPSPIKSPIQAQPKKKKGRPPGSTKQATAEKRRLLNTKEKSKNHNLDTSSEEDNEKRHGLPPSSGPKLPLSVRNRLANDNQHLTDESDELVPIKNSSGHSIPTQGGTIKRIHSSAIYSDSDSSSTDKDNRTDYTVSDSQQQPFRTKAAMKEFNENEVLPLGKLKKSADIPDSKKNATAVSTKKQPPTQSKKPDLPPPTVAVKKEVTTVASSVKASPSKANTTIKSRKTSTKLQNNLSSESEPEEVKKSILSNSNSSSSKDIVRDKTKKSDIRADFLVVPQREAAKKASENLMKTNSNQTAQSISTNIATIINSEKHNRRDKPDETSLIVPTTAAASVSTKTSLDTKETKSKSTSKSTKEKVKSDKATKDDQKKMHQQKEIAEKPVEKEIKKVEREKEETKFPSDFTAEFLPYVPQRQAAKKAAEHIKGLGNSSQTAAVSVTTDEKLKLQQLFPPTTTVAKKPTQDRRKIVAVELSASSSSASSTSSDSSGSDSDSEEPTPKQPKAMVKPIPKSLPTQRASTSLKQKTKESPFLDKVAKSSVNDEISSSSSYESNSSSDRPHSSRLSEKGGSKSKRKSIEQQTSKKTITPASSPKKSAAKKEIDKKSPVRRMSTMEKPSSQQQPSVVSPASKTATSNRSSQKPIQEPPKPAESAVTSRKRSTSITVASPPKVSGNNKSRASESSKRDLAKLSDKGKAVDISRIDSPSSKPEHEMLKRRRSSVLSPSSTPTHKSAKATPTKEIDIKSPTRGSKSTTTIDKESNAVKDESKSEPLACAEVNENANATSKNKKSDVVEIVEKSDTPRQDTVVVKEDSNKKIESSVVKMDSDDSKTERKSIVDSVRPSIQESKFDNSTPTMSSSPMISIPTENLNSMQDKSIGERNSGNVFEPAAIGRRENTFNALFESSKSNEDTERESYNLIEKLRQKNKKTCSNSNSTTTPNPTIIAENNNIVNEKPVDISSKSSCMHQNENTPKHDNFDQIQQQLPFKTSISSPLPFSKKDTEFSELKKSSPWHHHQQHIPTPNQLATESNSNYQRSILTSSCNKMNATVEQQSPAPASCMVVEQQQKQLAACQKLGEENTILSSNRSSMFISPMGGAGMLINEPPGNHLDHVFNMQMQQQKQQQHWPKDAKALMQDHDRLQQPNLMNRTNSGMENMMNNMNQQSMKNFNALHKSPLSNDMMHPHAGAQQGNFNSYNIADHSNQYPGAVSLFPPDLNVQVPFPSPSPGQAMFPPNFANTFTPSQQQQHPTNDMSIMMQTSNSTAHIKVNNNEITSNIRTFSGQNVCSTSMFGQQKPQLPNNELHMISNIQPECKNSVQPVLDKIHTESLKKSPAKSTRSSPRNTTPTHATHGGKTPQKSPSKSPRQPTTPASVESLSRQNSQKGKSTPSSNDGKQRKSRTNSQASPATTPSDHRGSNKGRARNNSKNAKGRFPQNVIPFGPFGSEMDFMSINKKLVGTVYDFSADEEFATNPSVENLRAMRDRRKSIDLYNKMNRDGSSQSPKFSKSAIKQSTPLTHPLALNNHTLTMPNTVVNENESIPVAAGITSLNLVNMPGPVDMRTYNSFDTNTNDSYNSQLLGAFATNMVDQTLNEIDEEQEKELQTALQASNDKQKTPTNNTSLNADSKCGGLNEVSNIVEESVDSEASFAKVSLSDSRNQLKLKIKGPLAQHHEMQSQSIAHHAQIAPQAASSGASSNRRQMRKKELLQQYWNQGMNIDQEPSNIVPNDQHVPPNISSNRVGGIPKAVDSMGLSLLKDEFQDFNYAEYKKRKRFALRGADYSVEMGVSNIDSMNAANEVDPLAIDTASINNKKRSRRPNRTVQQQQNVNNISVNAPPKLKIKIGMDVVETTGSDLPPKKRLIPAQPPSYQDLKRESMNFRKQMMEEFSEQKSKELKSQKRERKEKKKKKKNKKRSVEIVSQPAVVTEGAPVKLILKFGKKSAAAAAVAATNLTSSAETTTTTTTTIATATVSKAPPSTTPVNEQIKSTPPPIKLKLSRNSQGNGEYNILNTPKSSGANNNNLQPPIIDPSDINNITTKKLEVSLERIEDIEKAKSELVNKNKEDAAASNHCEVR